MNIKILNRANEEIIEQIREVEISCKTYDKTNGDMNLDTALNFDTNLKSLFLCYEDIKLVSVLSIFMPTAEEAEMSAYTLPEYRRKGYFTKLLNEAIKELYKYDPLDLLFVCEPMSKGGKETIKKLGAELDFTEYFLRYKGSLGDIVKQNYSQITLHKAGLGDIEAIVQLSQQIFNDSYEDAKSIVTKTFEANNRIQYAASLENRFVGIVSVSIENNEASIFGLGVVPPYQGRGIGKELLNLIINDLKRNGIDSITIEVDSKNKNAFHLYKKCGFEIETAFDYYRKHVLKEN